jgi:uncharacterized protein (DUF1499 family)
VNARHLALVATGLGVAVALAVALAGLGNRWGWWGPLTAFTVLRGSLVAGLLAALLALVAVVLALRAGAVGAAGWALLGLVLAVIAAAIPLSLQRMARSVPPIHDITTDTVNPPRLVALLELRRGAPNSAEHGGAEVAVQQRAAYPDIAPAVFAKPADAVFAGAVAAARRMGWTVVATVPAEGRLEATASTPWFGFVDDVVVRVTAAPQGARVDVRSVSRVGRSDLGANAKRIRKYIGALTRELT